MSIQTKENIYLSQGEKILIKWLLEVQNGKDILIKDSRGYDNLLCKIPVSEYLKKIMQSYLRLGGWDCDVNVHSVDGSSTVIVLWILPSCDFL